MDASTGNIILYNNDPNCIAALYIVKSLNHNFVTHFVFQHTSDCRSRRLRPAEGGRGARAEERVAALPRSPEDQAPEDLWAAGGAATLPEQSWADADADTAGREDRTRLRGLTYSWSTCVRSLLCWMLDSHALRLLQVRESSLEKQLDTPHTDLVRLQEERRVLQERVEVRTPAGLHKARGLFCLDQCYCSLKSFKSFLITEIIYWIYYRWTFLTETTKLEMLPWFKFKYEKLLKLK